VNVSDTVLSYHRGDWAEVPNPWTEGNLEDIGYSRRLVFGDELDQPSAEVAAYAHEGGRGWLVIVGTREHFVYVLAEDTADVLDLLARYAPIAQAAQAVDLNEQVGELVARVEALDGRASAPSRRWSKTTKGA